MAKQWFYKESDGSECGPYSGGELRKLVQLGRVRRESLVRTDTSNGSIPAGNIHGLFTEPEEDMSAQYATMQMRDGVSARRNDGPRKRPANDQSYEADYEDYGSPNYKPTHNVCAIASLVSGLLGWSFLPFVAAVVAIITGHIALKQIEESDAREDGKLMAMIGLILGYVQVAIAIVGIVTLCLLGIGLAGFFGAIWQSLPPQEIKPQNVNPPGAIGRLTPPGFQQIARVVNDVNAVGQQTRIPINAGAHLKAQELVRQFGGEMSYDGGGNPIIERPNLTLSFQNSDRWAKMNIGQRLTDAGLAELKNLPGDDSLVPFGPAALASWVGLSNFQKLILADTPITDAGLLELHGMKRLEYLDIAGTKATDDGLVKLLPTLPQLRILILGHMDHPAGGTVTKRLMAVTDRGLVAVGQSSALRSLSLSGTNMTDVGLASLAPLKNLQRLDLADTDITDAGLVHIMAMKQLRELNLSGTNVTDSGLGGIADHPQLIWLNLSQTKITDIGLLHLARLLKMRVGEHQTGRVTGAGFLNLVDTNVTDQGLAELRDLLPMTQIAPLKVRTSGLANQPPARVLGLDAERGNVERPVHQLKGSWDVSGLSLKQSYIIEFGGDETVTVKHKLGVSKISPWSYAEGNIRLGGSIRVNEIRVLGPWKARWNGEDEIDVTDPNGQELKLKRRTP
jgi:hypothetical protein